jgi:para-aminobenzoate synthetase/4-amino-4-deoxychorismate lyase
MGNQFFAIWDNAESGESFVWDRYLHWSIARSYEQGIQLLADWEKYSQTNWCLIGVSYEWGVAHAYEKSDILPSGEPCLYLAVLPEPRIIHYNLLDTILPLQGPTNLRSIEQTDDLESWKNKVELIKKNISEGETYQVNLTSSIELECMGSLSSLYLQLRKRQNVPYGLFIDSKELQILSFSPELFIQKTGDLIKMQPMKGTIPNTGKEPDLNPLLSDKNKSENIMIVDLIRNDLTKISKHGSVKAENLLQIKSFNTVHQLVSDVCATLKPNTRLDEILKAIFPSGSITGCPKECTTSLIRSLESLPRGFYTGALGYSKPGGDLVLNVAIRTLVGSEGKLRYGVGCGIVWDSNPDEEFQELKWKTKFLEDGSSNYLLIESFLDQKSPSLPKNFALHRERMEDSSNALGYPFSREDFKNQFLHLKNHPELSNVEDHKSYKCRATLNRLGEINFQWEEIFHENFIHKIVLSPRIIGSNNLFWKHKTSLREFYNSEAEFARKQGFDDVCFINERGELTECTKWNLFFLFEDGWKTPDLRSGLLPGVARGVFMENMDAFETRILIDELPNVQRICITNAVRGIQEARIFVPEFLSANTDPLHVKFKEYPSK